MKSKTMLLLILMLALAGYLAYKWKSLEQQSNPDTQIRNRGFDRRVSMLEYTKHALCRMDCRHISKSDVEEVLQKGEINYAKSDPADRPCPTYAVQGHSDDGQHLRVIFAQCDTKTKVVTCYDLEKDFECFCPGDEKKKKNKE